MLPVARRETHLASTSGHAGVELSFRKVERFSPEIERDACRSIGERLLVSRQLAWDVLVPYTRGLWNSRSQNASVIRDYFRKSRRWSARARSLGRRAQISHKQFHTSIPPAGLSCTHFSHKFAPAALISTWSCWTSRKRCKLFKTITGKIPTRGQNRPFGTPNFSPPASYRMGRFGGSRPGA